MEQEEDLFVLLGVPEFEPSGIPQEGRYQEARVSIGNPDGGPHHLEKVDWVVVLAVVEVGEEVYQQLDDFVLVLIGVKDMSGDGQSPGEVDD